MNDRERLQQWMQEQGVSPALLAKQLGVSRATVSYLLSGDRRVTPNIKWLFRKAFGSDAADAVFCDDVEPVAEAAPA